MRQCGFFDDGFADEIGERDFGGGDEPQLDLLLQIANASNFIAQSCLPMHFVALANPSLSSCRDDFLHVDSVIVAQLEN